MPGLKTHFAKVDALFSIVWLLLCTLSVTAQQVNEVGSPLLHYYSPSDYKAHPQNWAAVQDSTGRMFFANNHGVLRYDNQRWQLASSLNGGLIRSLVKDDQGNLFWGGQNDFGIVDYDSAGSTVLKSLTHLVPDTVESYNNVWNILINEDGAYFRTNKYIFRYHEDEISIISNDRWFQLGFVINERIVVQQFPHGLFFLDENTLTKIPNSEIFAKDNVSSILPLDNGNWLVLTFFMGIFEYDGTTFTPFRNDINDVLKKAMGYKALKLKSGNIAIGTIHNGLFLLSQNGELLNSIHIEQLPTTELYEDDHDGLWAVLDGGLARIELEAPLSFFGKNAGLPNGSVAVTRFENEVYAGAGSGLYHIVQDELSPAAFRKVADFSNQVWDLLPTEHGLLIGSQQGLFSYKNGAVTPILRNLVTRSLKKSRISSGLILVGNMNEFRTLTFQENAWKLSDPIPEIETNTHYTAETSDSVLWLGSHFQGVTRIENFYNDRELIISRYEDEQGFPERSDKYANTFFLNDHVAVGTSKGLYRLDEKTSLMIPDSSFGELFAGPGKDIFRIHKIFGDNWFIRSGDNGILTHDPDSGYFWNNLPFRRLLDGTTSDFYLDQDSVMWLATRTGVVRYDMKVDKNYVHTKKALLHKVSIIKNDSLIYGGHLPTQHQATQLLHHQNALRFQFSLPHFDDPQKTLFSFRLIGIDNEWGLWTTESQKDYTNLNFGTFTFEVRAKDMYGTVSHPARFTFTIAPPWYQSWLAYFVYFLGGFGVFIVIILGAVKWNGNRLEVRNQELEKQVVSRTKEIEEQKDVIEENLHEKEILLKEIHHRVKNNLQIIYSLLNLQKESIADENVLEAIKVGQGRIRSMSLIHEILYKNDDLKQVEVSRYIRNLVEHIEETFQKPETGVRTTFDIEPCEIDLNIAVPLGLTVNEVVSNAFKHAFIETKRGTLKVKGTMKKGILKLIISDNGPGISEGSELKETLGLLLIDDMIRQLKGSKDLVTTSGTSYTFNIPLGYDQS